MVPHESPVSIDDIKTSLLALDRKRSFVLTAQIRRCILDRPAR